MAGDPESTRESVEDGLVRTVQELWLRRSGECSSKEKRCDRNLGMRVKRTSEVKGTNKQTNKQDSPQKVHTEHQDCLHQVTGRLVGRWSLPQARP